ncbi:ABC transporter permease [Clostridium sediminicola]|uniref:ABC transporter permease n=1 Tax=Clostridium sediminicola TaxID=3114879 RepID=UPI0031F1D3A9
MKKRKIEVVFFFIIIMFLTIVTLFSFTPIALIVLRGLKHMKTAIQNKEIIMSISLSFKTSFFSTLICCFFSIPTAYGLSRYNFPLKRCILLLVYLPMSLPHMVSGIALLLFFSNTLFGELLSKYGLDFVFSVKGIVIAQVFVNMPYMIKMLKNTFDEMNFKMEFIARTLGCNILQSFYYITLPLCKKGLISTIVIIWSRGLGEFGAVLMLAGATRFKTETMPIAIFLNISTGDLDLAIATATILIIISMIPYVLFETVEKKLKFK